jgi:regulator of protease activity HflC (stomatin/prohibitin superfamily)
MRFQGCALCFTLVDSVVVVKEREVMIIERLGNFHSVLAAGVHFILPVIDRPKKFWFR